MKILYIVPYAPNLIRVRPYNLIRELVKRGHEVTVGTVWTNENDQQDIANLSKLVHKVESVHVPRWRSYRNCLLALPTRVPLQAVYSWQPALLNQFEVNLRRNGEQTQKFDIVHVEHLRGSQYGLKVKSLFPQIPIVWDSVDCISLLFKLAAGRSKRRSSKWISSFELKRNQWYEGWLTSQFDHTLVTSSIDRQALADLAKNNGNHKPKITVIPNGVDLDYFTPGDDSLRRKDTLVVSGKMSYHANVTMVLDLVEKIMPHIWSKQPEVKLWIVGKDPTPEIRSLDQKRGITVTGTVDDIRLYLRQATVAVAPISYGVGIQNKVLEAMACGTPLVATPQAVSTLSVANGKDLLVSDHPAQFAEHVIQLLENQPYREQIGRSGLQYVEANHKWSIIANRLEGIYYECIIRPLSPVIN
jgi:sugar transferase (PEP-CTERM/EpsH1 system associated)